MSWEKIGVVFPKSRAQLPVVSRDSDGWILTYSARDSENRSYGNIVRFAKASDRFIFDRPKVCIAPGKRGECDSAGTMPMQLIGNKLYYIGWTQRKDVPYFNYASVAILNDNFEIDSRGPILPPDLIDPGFSGTLQVIENELVTLGYYLSAGAWISEENGNLQPSYDIKIAESADGIFWRKTGKCAVGLEDGEAGLSGATIIKIGGVLHMWYSSRQGRGFRQKGESAYRIKHAYSLDYYSWHKTDTLCLEADGDENMTAYPSVFVDGEDVFLFYNGYSFGIGGVSCARLRVKELEVFGERFTTTNGEA